MSVRAVEWALAITGLEPGAHVLLLQLANLADEEASCFPSRRWLAARMGVSVDTIDRRMNALRELGLVVVETQQFDSGAQRVNRYVLPGAETVVMNVKGGAADVRPGGRKNAAGGAALRAAPIDPPYEYVVVADSAGAREAAWQRLVREVDHPLLNPSKTHAIITTGGEVQRWLDDGADFDADVVPVVRALVSRLSRPPGSWAYFRQAVRDAAAQRMAPPDPIQPAPARPAPIGKATRRGGYSLAEAGLKYLAELKADGRLDDER